MISVYREQGPPKSGKTTRLVLRANKAIAVGSKATLHTTEHAPGHLRAQYGLDPEVQVVVHPWESGRSAENQEWLVVDTGGASRVGRLL